LIDDEGEIHHEQASAEIEVPEHSIENDLDELDNFSEAVDASLESEIEDSDLSDGENSAKS
jgi:hypothetical protein